MENENERENAPQSIAPTVSQQIQSAQSIAVPIPFLVQIEAVQPISAEVPGQIETTQSIPDSVQKPSAIQIEGSGMEEPSQSI